VKLLGEGIVEALRLLASFEPQVMGAAWRSVWISSLAVLAAALLGIPIGTLLARRPFWGRDLLIILSRAGMAVPTVFIGVVLYGLLSRQGPLGPADLLYTPWAIVLGELLLALPMTISLSHGAIRALDPRVAQTARTLGAGALRRSRTYLSEARIGVTLAVLTAFARCVTELGIAITVGGSIRGYTRTLATAMALETGKGEFGRCLAMGFVLLAVALVVAGGIGALTRQTSRRP
jgi:tungstate transport system permease protein